ncbi:MAG: glycosyltransferase family 39 protein [Chloroflexota bacterium]|nr:glycosyltransferase family 39 protein [Chloroflexota bacterium]
MALHNEASDNKIASPTGTWLVGVGLAPTLANKPTLTQKPGNAIKPDNESNLLEPRSWLYALKQVLPVYIATHVVFLLLTYFAKLFVFQPKNFSGQTFQPSTLLDSWLQWDTVHYLFIAEHGYDIAWRTAFFPFYSLCIRVLMVVIPDPLAAALLISNTAGLAMMIVLYRIVQEDFDEEIAYRTVLYLSFFPTAFFLAAAYNETLFLFFGLVSFYNIRHGHWWIAGVFGFFAALTRSVGILLCIPFLYEYLRQRSFNLKAIRADILAIVCIPAAVAAFALYCYHRFHDPLAFSHAETFWKRSLHGPWDGLGHAVAIIATEGIVSFNGIHNAIDLSAGLLMLVLTVLCFVGPWKFPRSLLVYGIYAVVIYLMVTSFPSAIPRQIQSLSRYVLELFPAFIVLARIGKNKQGHLYYLMLSTVLLAFLLLQFLTKHWVV